MYRYDSGLWRFGCSLLLCLYSELVLTHGLSDLVCQRTIVDQAALHTAAMLLRLAGGCFSGTVTVYGGVDCLKACLRFCS